MQLASADCDLGISRDAVAVADAARQTAATFRETHAERGADLVGVHAATPQAPYRTPLSIAFAFVATHNHFVLDRGGKVFKQTAPVIKLPEGATRGRSSRAARSAELVDGVLLAQAGLPQQGQRSGTRGGIGADDLGRSLRVHRHHVAGLPAARRRCRLTRAPTRLTWRSELRSRRRRRSVAARRCQRATSLDEARGDVECDSGRDDRDAGGAGLGGLPPLRPARRRPHLRRRRPARGLRSGERAFEIVSPARSRPVSDETAWFARHGSTPITEIPAHWPPAYRELVERRIDLIESDPYIRLLERPEYKRRWASRAVGEAGRSAALRGWLLDRLEDARFWFDAQGRPTPRRVGAAGRCGGPRPDLGLGAGAVGGPARRADRHSRWPSCSPTRRCRILAAYRYKDSGLRKRAAWEHTWDAAAPRGRRREGRRPIPVPPKYTSADFRKTAYWQAPRQARRAQGAVHPLPRRRPRHRPDACARLGRLGPRAAGARPRARSSASARPRAGTTSDSSRWSPGWPSCSRGSSSGTPRSTRRYGVSLADVLPGAAAPSAPRRSTSHLDELAAWRPAAAARRTGRRSRRREHPAARRHRHPRARRRRGLRAAAHRRRRRRPASQQTLDELRRHRRRWPTPSTPRSASSPSGAPPGSAGARSSPARSVPARATSWRCCTPCFGTTRPPAPRSSCSR